MWPIKWYRSKHTLIRVNLCCVDPLTLVVMVVIGLKRSLLSNKSLLSNTSCYLNSLIMTIGKDLSLAKKKLDYLRMKICKGVRLRRVKVKGLARIR